MPDTPLPPEPVITRWGTWPLLLISITWKHHFGVGNISPKYLYVICNGNQYNIIEKIEPIQMTHPAQADIESLGNNSNGKDTSDDLSVLCRKL